MNTEIVFGQYGLWPMKKKVEPENSLTKIRELQKSDRKKVLDLMNEFPEIFPPQYVNSGGFGGMVSFLNFARSASPEQIGSFVIEVNGVVVGHIAYAHDVRYFEKGAYEIKGAVIGRDYQKKGYGAKLVQHATDQLREVGAEFAYLITRKPTVMFFSKLDFAIIGLQEYSFNGTCKKRYVMGKKL